jgi:hypothetical protein
VRFIAGLDDAARIAAQTIQATGDVATGIPRFLLLLGDRLQSLPVTERQRTGGGVANGNEPKNDPC